VKTKEERVHTARESGHRSDEATDLGIEHRTLDQDAIARLAYFHWEERGCLSMAAKKGTSLAGRKGPPVWLRNGLR